MSLIPSMRDPRSIMRAVYPVARAAITLCRRGAARVSAYGLEQGLALKEPLLVELLNYAKTISILSQPKTFSLMSLHPNLVNVCFRSYLVESFEKPERRAALAHHYNYIERRVRSTFYPDIYHDRTLLWGRKSGDTAPCISLIFDTQYHAEGDLTLVMTSGGVKVYALAFSIVPGPLVGLSDSEVLLVTRVQGQKAQLEAIRRATKSCYDVAPPFLLLDCAKAIARTLGVTNVVGVSSREQIGVAGDEGESFDYDAFWNGYLGSESAARFYTLPVAYSGKALEQINAAHRRRTKRKRQFRRKVSEEVGASFADLCLNKS